jgi:hypothetical protein
MSGCAAQQGQVRVENVEVAGTRAIKEKRIIAGLATMDSVALSSGSTRSTTRSRSPMTAIGSNPGQNANDCKLEWYFARRLRLDLLLGDRGQGGADVLWFRRW